MKQTIISISNDEKVIENTHRWLNPTFEVVIGLSSHNLESSYNLIKKMNAQILILDTSPSTSFSYQLLERLNKEHFELIVISDNSEDANRAISFGLIDFLLKPLTEKKLIEAIKKAFLKLEEKKLLQSLKEKHKNIENGGQSNRIISLPLLKGKSIKLKIEEIIRFESNGTMTHAYLKNSTKEFTVINCSIKECEVLLKNQDFFRTHRKHLVNLNSIISLSSEGSKRFIILFLGITLLIARRRYSEFLFQYDEFRNSIEV